MPQILRAVLRADRGRLRRNICIKGGRVMRSFFDRILKRSRILSWLLLQDRTSGRLAPAAAGKELAPAGDCLLGKIEKARDILDGQTFGEKKQGIGHAGLNDFGRRGVQRLSQAVAVLV